MMIFWTDAHKRTEIQLELHCIDVCGTLNNANVSIKFIHLAAFHMKIEDLLVCFNLNI